MADKTTRVPARVLEHMRGSQCYHDRQDWPEAHDLIVKIENKKQRKDGSRHLQLTEAEQDILRDWAGNLAVAARDDAGWDADARADLNSARATLRALA